MSSISAERRAPRLRTRARVRLHVFDGHTGELQLGQIHEAESRDFTSRGLFLTGVALPCTTRVHLYIELPTGWIETFGVVVHNQPQRDAHGLERVGVGVRLTRLSFDDEQRLEAFLDVCRDATQAALHAALARLRAEQISRRPAITA